MTKRHRADEPTRYSLKDERRTAAGAAVKLERRARPAAVHASARCHRSRSAAEEAKSPPPDAGARRQPSVPALREPVQRRLLFFTPKRPTELGSIRASPAVTVDAPPLTA